jgi:hypothetical protein
MLRIIVLQKDAYRTYTFTHLFLYFVKRITPT